MLAGRSMEPTLLVGDVLTVEPLERPAHVGDVIVFEAGEGTHLCHRVVAVARGPGSLWYVHRGDAHGARLGTVRATRVLGRVTAVRRHGSAVTPNFAADVPLSTLLAAHVHLARLAVRRARIDAHLTLRMDVREARRGKAGLIVREVTPEELRALLPALGLRTDEVDRMDRVTPVGWRAFVVFDGERPVHRSAISPRPRGPTLWACWTPVADRGRGAFRMAVTEIARVLGEQGEPYLYSTCRRSNVPSVRAHLAAGFEISKTQRFPVILGDDAFALARRKLRRILLRAGH